jgi:hypothetical protein
MMLRRQQTEERRMVYEKVKSEDRKAFANASWQEKTVRAVSISRTGRRWPRQRDAGLGCPRLWPVARNSCRLRRYIIGWAGNITPKLTEPPLCVHLQDKKVAEQNVIRRFNSLRTQQQEQVGVRRQHLAQILASENEAYANEIMSMQETPESVKARMEARAKQLKDAREQERVKYVEDMNYRKWRAGCDDLRDADSKNFLLACHLERDKQVLEKLGRKELEERENMLFDALWEEQRQARVRMDEEQEDKLAKNVANVQVVMAEQLEALRARKEEDAKILEEEAELQKELWLLANEEERRKAVEAAEAAFVRNQELQRFNVEKLKEREEALRIERELDLAFLDAVLKKEAAQEASELAKKSAYAEAAAQYRKHLMALMVKEADDNAVLDQMRADEFEKAWGKRVEVWAREQEARERLMAHVMEERRRQIDEKYGRLEREKEEEMADRQRLLEDLERGAGLDVAHIERRKLFQEENDRIIKAQVREKQMRAERATLMEQRELRALQIAEQQYQQRLAAEKNRMQSQTMALLQHGQ